MISKNFKKRFITSLFLLLITLLIISFNFMLIYSLLILSVLSIIEFGNLTKKIFRSNSYIILFNIFFISYIFLFCFFSIFLSNFIQLKLILFSLLFGCIASDIGGYSLGKILKGPKLTKISPKKTISGAIGSLIFSVMVISFFIYFFTNKFDFKIIIVGICTSLSCQLGDLFFSYLKRKAKLKDTGNFLPGHGGVLDRIDGILLGVPLGFLTIIMIF